MDLITGMEIVFDVELPVRTLLLHPTVEEFAAAVDDLLTPQESRDEDHRTASVGARSAG
jgi:hypothetical protein